MQIGNSTITKVIRSWQNQFPTKQLERSICLIGPMQTGKSSFCELCKKYIQKDPYSQIQLDKQKYVLPDIISTSSMKAFTISPKAYKIRDIKLIDIPCMVLNQGQGLQYKIATQYFLRSFKKCTFLLLVNQASTKHKLDTWKKTIISFIQYFNFDYDNMSLQLMNSVGMLFVKCPSNLDNQKMSNRIPKLLAQFKNYPKKQIAQNLLNKIIENKKNSVHLFYKAQNEEIDGQRIQKTFQQIYTMPFVEMDTIHLAKISNFSKTEINQIDKYWINALTTLKQLKVFLHKIINQQFNDQIEFFQARQKLKSNLFQNYNPKINSNQTIEYIKIPQIHQIGQFCIQFFQNISKIQRQVNQTEIDSNKQQQKQKRSCIILKCVKLFYDYGLLDLNKDKIILQNLKQLMNFFEIMRSQQSLNNLSIVEIVDLAQSFLNQRQRQQLLHKIINKFQDNRQINYYKSIRLILQKIGSRDKNIQLKIKCRLKIAQNAEDIQALQQFIDIYQIALKNQNRQKLGDIYYQIGKKLELLQEYSLAFQMYRKSGHLYYTLQFCKRIAQKGQIKTLSFGIQLTNFMIDLFKLDEAYTFCLQLGQIFTTLEEKRDLGRKISLIFTLFPQKGESPKTNEILLKKYFQLKQFEQLQKEEEKQLNKAVENLKKTRQEKRKKLLSTQK